jgi:hypothetical protein
MTTPDPGSEPGRASIPGQSSAENTHLPPGHGTGAGPDTATTGDAQAGDGGSAEAQQIAEKMGRLVRDLEFTPGLREPLQQTVSPQPDPWRPDPSREGPPPVVEEVTPLRVRTTGGDRVTIRGKNLRVVQVMFGSAPARLLSAGDTLVAVEAPPSGAGPVTIAVTNDDGTWALSSTPITYAE